MATFPFTWDAMSSIELIYIGYFGRAGDPTGTNYWIAQDFAGLQTVHTLTGIAASFSVQAEAKAEYAFLNDPLTASTTGPNNALDQFINQVYQNLFGHNADGTDTTGGLGYWRTNILNALATHDAATLANQLGVFILQVAFGAQAADQAVLQAKVTVADFITQAFTAKNILFGNDGSTADHFAHTDVASVHGPGDVVAAEAAATAFADPTFTLTVGQDTFTTGTGFDSYNAPLAGIFGNQPTLTAFDTIVDSGNYNALNAFFNLGILPITVGGLTIEGIQTWTFEKIGAPGVGNLTILGGATVGGPGPSGAAASPGVQTINYNNSIGSLFVGSGATGIQSVVTNLNLNNDVTGAGGQQVTVFSKSNLFTGTDTLTVGVNNSTGFGVNAGPDAGATGYQNWIVQILDSTGDNVFLGADGATNGKSVAVTNASGGTGGAGLFAYAGHVSDWVNVQSIDGSGLKGFFTVSGAEDGVHGFLGTDAVALKSLVGGTGGLFADLTSLSVATAHALTAVNGGSGLGEVAFNNTVLTTNASIAFSNISLLDDASDSQGGPINMGNFPLVGTLLLAPELQFLASDGTVGGTLNSDLTITNGLTVFDVAFNSLNYNDHNITISAGLGNINGGNDTMELGLSSNGICPTFTINNYTMVDVGVNDTDTIGGTTFIDNAPIGAPNPTVDISGIGNLVLGNVGVGIGPATVQINGFATTTINTNGGLSGWIDMGGTNAMVVDASHALNLVMEDPGANTATGITVLGGTDPAGHVNLLQGTMGTVLGVANVGVRFTDTIGNDTITGGAGADNIFGDGGNDTINLNSAGVSAATDSTVWIGRFEVGHGGTQALPSPGLNPVLAFTDITAGAEVTTGIEGLTITNGFMVGAAGDVFSIAHTSWVNGALGGGVTDKGLVNGDGNSAVTSGTSTLQLIVAPTTQIASNASIVLDGISTYADASALVHALKTAGIGDLMFNGLGMGKAEVSHMLIAYSTGTAMNIADVKFVNTTGATQTDTANLTEVSAVDLVSITGQAGSPSTVLGHLDPHNFIFT